MPASPDDLDNFAQAIVRGDDSALNIAPHYANYSAAVALAVYRNNYRGNLHDALAGAYPVTAQLVGEAFFRRLAYAYGAAHPSHSGNLHDYGEQMAQFLAGFEPARTLAYLPDVAALEWACHRAYFADDADVLGLAELALLPPEQYGGLVLHLHPACRMLHSRYPLAAIWHAHQPDMPDEFRIDLDSGPCHALVVRRDDAVDVVELSAADAAWLQLLQSGMALGASAAVALEQYPDFDLRAALASLAMLRVLTGFAVEETA